jgi:hypothetical protein
MASQHEQKDSIKQMLEEHSNPADSPEDLRERTRSEYEEIPACARALNTINEWLQHGGVPVDSHGTSIQDESVSLDGNVGHLEKRDIVYKVTEENNTLDLDDPFYVLNCTDVYTDSTEA